MKLISLTYNGKTGSHPRSVLTNNFTPVTTDNYKEIISYDANGNIQTYLRNGNIQWGSPLAMDNITYHYKPNTNQLDHVTDAVPASNYSIDIDNQNVLNYSYDEIGNLTKDAAEGITSIKWNVYGKITDISKSDGTKINYTYDPAGNRISKTVNNKKTFYVRDASGNIMSVYTKDAGVNGGDLSRTESHLYGSSRLGMSTLITNVENPTATHGFETGLKVYEGTNHLGNVLITFSDKKIAIPKPSPYSEEIDYYVADVVGANDYYSFGMAMPGRTYNSSSLKYHYGFNGKENDNEVKGEGNQQDYGMKISDPRLGKFLSVDPLSREFSWNSSYSYSENSPIAFIDLNGAEKFPYQNPSTLPKIGTSKFYTTTQGSSAEIFKIQEFGKTYNITKITVYEQSKDAFGRIHHFNNYYFVQDNALVNEEDQPTQSGTTFKTQGTNWHYYLSENNGMSRQFKQTSGVGEGLGTAFFCGALAVAAIPTLPYVANALVNTGGFTSAGASEEIGKRIGTAGANAVIQGIQIASGKQSSYNVTSTLVSFLTANPFGGAVWTTGGELLNNQSMTFEGTLTSFAVNAGGNFLGNVMTKNVGGNIGSINPLTNAKYSFLGSLGGNSAVMINETYKDLNTKLETP